MRTARLPSGPWTAACAPHRGLEAIAEAPAARARRGPPRLGPAPPRRAPDPPPAASPPRGAPAAAGLRRCGPAVPYIYTRWGAGDQLTCSVRLSEWVQPEELTRWCHAPGSLVHGRAPLPPPSPLAPTPSLPALARGGWRRCSACIRAAVATSARTEELQGFLPRFQRTQWSPPTFIPTPTLEAPGCSCAPPSAAAVHMWKPAAPPDLWCNPWLACRGPPARLRQPPIPSPGTGCTSGSH